MKAHPQPPRTADHHAWSREFARLYRQWYRPVVALCREYGGSSVDAEAVAQEAFTRAWLAWGRFSADRPFGPWIVTIARRLCFDHLARMERQTDTLHHAAALFDPPATNSAEDIAAAVDTAVVVNTILRTLPPRQRQVLELREIEGWSYEHIAQATGASVEGVRGLLRRARRSFRTAFAQMNGLIGGFGLVAVRVRDAVQRWRLPRGEAVNALGQWASTELVGLLLPVMLASGATVAAAGPEATVTAPPSPPSLATTAPVDRADEAQVDTALPAAAAPRPRLEANGPASGISDSITSIAVSPSYKDDRTVFASGVSSCGLPRGCPVLYRSTDGGRSWVRLPAAGRTEGEVMVPPAYPRDRRIFSAGVGELQVSDDDGSTFRTIAITHGAATMSPLFSNGDPRIFFGGGWTNIVVGAGMEYRDGDGVKPLSLSLPPGASPEHFAFSEAYAADRVMLIGGTYRHPGRTVRYSVTFECAHDECRMHDFGVAVGSPTVVGRSSRHPEAFAATPYGLWRSRANGAAFEPIAYPSGRSQIRGMQIAPVVRDLIRLADGTLLLSIEVDAHDRRGRLYSSRDSGDTWSPLTATDGVAIDKLVQLPDGRLLGAGVLGVGLFCSIDTGRTWTSTCA